MKSGRLFLNTGLVLFSMPRVESSRSDVAAADGTRVVRGQQQRLFAKRRDALVDRVVQPAGIPGGLLRVGQVGAAGLADEKRIAREQHPAGAARILGVDGVTHALRRMTRRLERDESGRSDREFFTRRGSTTTASSSPHPST